MKQLNNAGGETNIITQEDAFVRFLVLGTEGGTYYTDERKQTLQATENMVGLFRRAPMIYLDILRAFADSNRVVKHRTVLFALAVALKYAGEISGSSQQQRVHANLHTVARSAIRTGSHMQEFNAFCKALGKGWGRSRRGIVRRWFESRDADSLAYQILKYRNRYGWTQRDLLRVSHPKVSDSASNALLKLVVSEGDSIDLDLLPETAVDYLRLQAAKTPKEAAVIIANASTSIPWEFVPTELLGSPDVWTALLPSMPQHALLRNMGRMSANGTLDDAHNRSFVSERLLESSAYKRVHPFTVVQAMLVYRSGGGVRSNLAWVPHNKIVNALDAAVMLAYGQLPHIKQRLAIGLDVSGSMGITNLLNVPGLTPYMAEAVIALAIKRSSPHSHVLGFTTTVEPIELSDGMTVWDAMGAIMRLGNRMGGTDCSLLFQAAAANNVTVDGFVTLTDNETWAMSDAYSAGWRGRISGAAGRRGNPQATLGEYRKRFNPHASSVVGAMTVTDFTIADPNDLRQLDIVGMDSAYPNILAQFLNLAHGGAYEMDKAA